MDGCSSHSDLVDDRSKVTVMTYPPNCTSVHQPMDHGIIAATKLNYGKELLDAKVSTMRVAETLRTQAKERKMVTGTVGLAEEHHPYMLDVADLLKLGWDNITQKTIARYVYLICCTQRANNFFIPTARLCAWGNILTCSVHPCDLYL